MSFSTEGDEIQTRSLYFVLFAALLATVFILAKQLHDHKRLNAVFSEAALVLMVGMITGGITRSIQAISSTNQNTDDDAVAVESVLANSILSFSPNVFFMALLPPILFHSGYGLRRELFYRHIKPIALFAAVGTLLSALVTGLSLYGIGRLGGLGAFQPSVLELLTFGSLIAATDTVSVVAVLQAKRVDPHLFYLTLGESALNDAVALVLFESFGELLEKFGENGQGTLARSTLQFGLDFSLAAVGSPALGILFGVGAALVFKRSDFRDHKMLELGLYSLCMYVPYTIAECINLSGIVSIFFAGMSARRYIVPNLSTETAHNGEAIFGLAAYLAEICIFLELGMSLWGLKAKFSWAFIGWSLLACLIGRAVAIYPLANLWNCSLKESQLNDAFVEATESFDIEVVKAQNDDGLFQDDVSVSSASISAQIGFASRIKRKRRTPVKRKDKKISLPMMHFLWFAGLRGAVAYACARKFPGANRDEFIAATMFIVLFTIVIMGGATELLLGILKIATNVDEDKYMEEWHKQRMLRGAFHDFEHKFFYAFAVRDTLSESGEDTELEMPSHKRAGTGEHTAFDYHSGNDL